MVIPFPARPFDAEKFVAFAALILGDDYSVPVAFIEKKR
jgi:hypothetical protein